MPLTCNPNTMVPMHKVLLTLVFLIYAGVFPGAQEKRIVLTFIGDIMAHRINYVLPDYTAIYASVEDYLSADFLSFGNLESPVDSSREYSSYPRFNVAKEYVEAALLAGVDVLSLGNNHAFDQGREGIFQTLRSLKELEEKLGRRVYTSGIRGNLSAPFVPTLIVKEGLRIGFLAVTQMVNQYQRFEYVQIMDYLNGRHQHQFLSYIRRAAGNYDLFILSYHGGREYARNADPVKLRFFRQLVGGVFLDPWPDCGHRAARRRQNDPVHLHRELWKLKLCQLRRLSTRGPVRLR